MLSVTGVTAGYGLRPVLKAVSLEIAPGEIVAVLGANGAGKSTLLRAISGEIAPTEGQIVLDGERIDGLQPNLVSRRGLAHVLEGRHVFRGLSVDDNLRVACPRRTPRPAVDQRLVDAYTIFPVLAERTTIRAGLLSGGQQQMLVIARALMSEPKVVLIDEPSLGLAPIAVQAIEVALARLVEERKLAVLLVEQTVAVAQTVATRGFAMHAGILTVLPDLRTLKREQLAAAYLGGATDDLAIV